jgi:hypothetical protein
MGPSPAVPALSTEQLVDLLALLKGADSVELKLSVPDSHRRSTVAALGMDPLEAQLRQVVFFDTPDLTLNARGVVVRARRIQRKQADSIVKLRPVDPATLPEGLLHDRRFSVEVDAQPGGFVCSGTMKDDAVADADVKEVLAGRRAISTLFTKKQRALVATYTDDVVELDDLSVLGPINVAKLKWTPEDFTRRLVAELWFYPDGGRILELSTKCAPADAFTVAAETKAYVASHGVDLGAEQQTKTRSALEFFARELAAS